MATTPFLARIFEVRIDYLSGGETFAVETIRLEEIEGCDIEATARASAEASVYYDPRVPDLTYQLAITPIDPEDPNPPPPAAQVKPICPHCGADELVRDACVRWDVETQTWEVSGIYDSTTCNLCGAESDDLAHWVPARQVTATELYIAAVADLLGTPGLLSDPRFEPFCLAKFLDHSAVEAAEAWTARDQRSS